MKINSSILWGGMMKILKFIIKIEGLYLIIAIATIIFTSISTYETIKISHATQKSLNLEMAPALQLDCDVVPKNTSALPHSLHALLLGFGEVDIYKTIPIYMNPSKNNKGGFIHIPGPFIRCILTNYGRLPAMNIRLDFNYYASPIQHFPVRAKETDKIFPNTTYLAIPGLGSGQSYKFIIANGTNFYIYYILPQIVWMTTPVETWPIAKEDLLQDKGFRMAMPNAPSTPYHLFISGELKEMVPNLFPGEFITESNLPSY